MNIIPGDFDEVNIIYGAHFNLLPLIISFNIFLWAANKQAFNAFIYIFATNQNHPRNYIFSYLIANE